MPGCLAGSCGILNFCINLWRDAKSKGIEHISPIKLSLKPGRTSHTVVAGVIDRKDRKNCYRQERQKEQK